jgi:hypothetical protein
MANRRTSVTFAVFGYVVHVIIAANVERTGRRLGEDLTGADAGYVTKADDPMRGWLVLSTRPEPGTISHESSHAIRAMLEAVGATLDDETFAYHLDYLVGRIHAFLKR